MERIVQAVLRRLPADALSRGASTSGELRLSERVVSVEALRDLPRGTKHIVISPRAIVTPAAKDLLKAQGVSVRREAAGAASAANGVATTLSTPLPSLELVTFACETPLDLVELAGLAAKSDVRCRLANAVPHAELAGFLASLAGGTSPQRSICFTSQNTLVLCAANRHPQLRAAAANCSCCVREAAGAIGANLLVVNPKGKSLHQLSQLVREFAACDGTCSAATTQLLRTLSPSK